MVAHHQGDKVELFERGLQKRQLDFQRVLIVGRDEGEIHWGANLVENIPVYGDIAQRSVPGGSVGRGNVVGCSASVIWPDEHDGFNTVWRQPAKTGSGYMPAKKITGVRSYQPNQVVCACRRIVLP